MPFPWRTLANSAYSVVSVEDALTTVGGAAAEVVSISGVKAGDMVSWSIIDGGTSSVTGVSAVADGDQVTFTFSADPGNDAIISYSIYRA